MLVYKDDLIDCFQVSRRRYSEASREVSKATVQRPFITKGDIRRARGGSPSHGCQAKYKRAMIHLFYRSHCTPTTAVVKFSTHQHTLS